MRSPVRRVEDRAVDEPALEVIQEAFVTTRPFGIILRRVQHLVLCAQGMSKGCARAAADRRVSQRRAGSRRRAPLSQAKPSAVVVVAAPLDLATFSTVVCITGTASTKDSGKHAIPARLIRGPPARPPLRSARGLSARSLVRVEVH
eukprot:1336243-Prymnesium_polylepis.1